MSKAEALRARFRARDLVIGGHVFFTDSAITEQLGYHGYEFVWIDAEHGAFDKACILSHIIAASASGTASLVRVAWNDPVLVKPILEMGPDGIILPMVCTAGEAKAAVAACEYPPKGVRGFGPRRANRYGQMDLAEYLVNASRQVLKIVQIEHVDAVGNLPEILATPGLDLIVVGPNDLSASVGHLGETRHPEVVKLLNQVAETCKQLNKPFGVSLGPNDKATIEDWIKRGVSFIGCGDDVSFISAGAKATVKHLQSLKMKTRA